MGDDDEVTAESYTTFLVSICTVRTTTGGTEALEHVDATINIVLPDRWMPDMIGDEVLAELRDRGLDCQLSMLTSVEPDADIVDMPFNDYKTKPANQDDLVDLVGGLLNRSTDDEQSQQYHNLAWKNALEVARNDRTDERHTIVGQMNDLRKELETTLDEIGAEDAFIEPFAD